MYKVFCDNYLLYDSNLESLTIYNPKVSLALNAVSSFEFTIYPEHPYFERMEKLKSIITVRRDDSIIFRGRILSDKNGIYNEKKVVCENDLAFLLDSIQRPYEFQGTPAELFTQFITAHNAQVNESHRFKVGNITVHDPNDYINRADSTYLNTFESIKQKLIDGLEGFLWLRYEEDGTYIDYLEDFNLLSPQTIEFGKNLISYSKNVSADDIFTVIIPFGSSDEEGNKIDIKAVNGGLDYLENTEAIERFGRITKVVEWPDVTIPNNLKTKAQRLLDSSVLLLNSIEITSADLAEINHEFGTFALGTKVHVISKPNGIDDFFLVKNLTLDLLNPANNKLKIGSKFYSLTERQNNEIKTLTNQVVTKVENVKTEAIFATTKQFQADIKSTSDSILANVSENYYLKGETDSLISSVNTAFEQTAQSFEFRFNKFSADLESLANGTNSEFENIRKYIRFEDGTILLGEVGKELELRIANDRIQFLSNNNEVAYFSNNKLFVVDGEFTNSLQLGKFAFLPRPTGNLSFKKVRD